MVVVKNTYGEAQRKIALGLAGKSRMSVACVRKTDREIIDEC